MWTSFLGGAFEGELREGGKGRVVGDSGVVDINGAVVDGCYDEVIDGGNVLDGVSNGLLAVSIYKVQEYTYATTIRLNPDGILACICT